MQRIGRYEVLATLGEGGMGAVYEVQPLGGTERLALKLQLGATPEGTERFLREARVLEFLGRHPNIVRFRDAGEERGRPFLVMDLLRGGSLEDRLRDKKITTDAAVAVLIAVARAAHFAHEAGVVHRDLKPSNVLFDDAGRPFLTDFGLAKKLDDEKSLTKTGSVMGTYEYMSPEQVDAQKGQLDRRTDVYALGAILYRILTGKTPFSGSALQLMTKVMLENPRPPRAVAEGISPELEAVCLKALAKDPKWRQPTAEAFARELEQCVEPAPRRPVPKSLLLSGAANGLLLVAIGALAVAGRSRPDAGPAWREAKRLLQAGVSLGDDMRATLGAGAAGRGTGELEELRRFWPLANVESALLAGDAAEARKLAEGLPESAEKSLLDAEARSAAGDLDAALRSLERGESASLPWRSDRAADRWARLAERFEKAGKADRAARAFVLAAVRAAGDGREPAGRAAGLIDRACDLSLSAVIAEVERAKSILLAAARESLALTDGGGPDAIRLARRRLLRVRLLAPDAPAPREALDRLASLGESPSERVRRAARPWVVAGVDPEKVEALLRTPISAEAAKRIDSRTHATWPRGWHEDAVNSLWRLADAAPLRYEIFSEWVLWRPEPSFLWLNLGRAAEALDHVEEARRIYEVATRKEDSAQASYWAGLFFLHTGHPEDAIPLIRNVMEKNVRDGLRYENDDRELLARALLATKDPGHAREARELLKQVPPDRPGVKTLRAAAEAASAR